MIATIANDRERRPAPRMATSLTRDRSALRRVGDAGRSVPRDRDALDRDDDKEEGNAHGRGDHDRRPGIGETKESRLGDDELPQDGTRPAEVFGGDREWEEGAARGHPPGGRERDDERRHPADHEATDRLDERVAADRRELVEMLHESGRDGARRWEQELLDAERAHDELPEHEDSA